MDALITAIITAASISIASLVFFTVAMALVRRFLYICDPNQILIFSGRKRLMADGSSRGFRVIHGGRAWRVPFVERTDHMDMTLISVPMSMTGAYSEGGIPLSVHAIANVKISSNPAVVGNAIERFLGRSREDIARVVKETLEGHLRGVLATMTPEEVNEDRLKFAEQMTNEAEPDLHKLGLQLDTLKIQSVTDDRQYLDSIGRAKVAEILRTAEVAESDAVRAAEEAEAAARARGTVALTRAQMAVQRKANEKRELQAQLEATARSAEERAEQVAAAARATAEKQLQEIRSELERLRLQANVTVPAEIERRVQELLAEGEAASLEANGQAIASSVSAIHKAWKNCEGDPMDMIVVQHMDQIFEAVTSAAARTQAKEVSLLDPGDGRTISAYADAYPATVQRLFDRITETLGVDVQQVLRGTSTSNEAQ